LSNNRNSYLIFSSNDSIPTPLLNTGQPEGEFNLLICAAHYLGDGMALHRFAHNFFTLLASPSSVYVSKTSSTERWGPQAVAPDLLPCSIEESMPEYTGRFRRAVAAVDFNSNQNKQIGGR
jgi:hypothetical protein